MNKDSVLIRQYSQMRRPRSTRVVNYNVKNCNTLTPDVEAATTKQGAIHKLLRILEIPLIFENLYTRCGRQIRNYD